MVVASGLVLGHMVGQYLGYAVEEEGEEEGGAGASLFEPFTDGQWGELWLVGKIRYQMVVEALKAANQRGV